MEAGGPWRAGEWALQACMVCKQAQRRQAEAAGVEERATRPQPATHRQRCTGCAGRLPPHLRPSTPAHLHAHQPRYELPALHGQHLGAPAWHEQESDDQVAGKRARQPYKCTVTGQAPHPPLPCPAPADHAGHRGPPHQQQRLQLLHCLRVQLHRGHGQGARGFWA